MTQQTLCTLIGGGIVSVLLLLCVMYVIHDLWPEEDE